MLTLRLLINELSRSFDTFDDIEATISRLTNRGYSEEELSSSLFLKDMLLFFPDILINTLVEELYPPSHQLPKDSVEHIKERINHCRKSLVAEDMQKAPIAHFIWVGPPTEIGKELIGIKSLKYNANKHQPAVLIVEDQYTTHYQRKLDEFLNVRVIGLFWLLQKTAFYLPENIWSDKANLPMLANEKSRHLCDIVENILNESEKLATKIDILSEHLANGTCDANLKSSIKRYISFLQKYIVRHRVTVVDYIKVILILCTGNSWTYDSDMLFPEASNQNNFLPTHNGLVFPGHIIKESYWTGQSKNTVAPLDFWAFYIYLPLLNPYINKKHFDSLLEHGHAFALIIAHYIGTHFANEVIEDKINPCPRNGDINLRTLTQWSYRSGHPFTGFFNLAMGCFKKEGLPSPLERLKEVVNSDKTSEYIKNLISKSLRENLLNEWPSNLISFPIGRSYPPVDNRNKIETLNRRSPGILCGHPEICIHFWDAGDDHGVSFPVIKIMSNSHCVTNSDLLSSTNEYFLALLALKHSNNFNAAYNTLLKCGINMLNVPVSGVLRTYITGQKSLEPLWRFWIIFKEQRIKVAHILALLRPDLFYNLLPNISPAEIEYLATLVMPTSENDTDRINIMRLEVLKALENDPTKKNCSVLSFPSDTITNPGIKKCLSEDASGSITLMTLINFIASTPSNGKKTPIDTITRYQDLHTRLQHLLSKKGDSTSNQSFFMPIDSDSCREQKAKLHKRPYIPPLPSP